jgi:hypothetical protein
MANDNSNPVVAYIEGRIAAWQAALNSVKSAMAGENGGQSIEGMELTAAGNAQGGGTGLPIDLPEGAFLGKSIPACIKLYLSASRKKKTVKEIAAALIEGGVESTSSKFENNVTSSLNRLKTAGEVLRFKDGWGLPEWYPAHIRSAAPGASAKRIPQKPTRRGRKVATPKQVSTASARLALAQGKTSDRIVELLRTNPDREYSSEEIAAHIGAVPSVANMVLGTLRKSGKVKMSAPGLFAIGRPQLVASGD